MRVSFTTLLFIISQIIPIKIKIYAIFLQVQHQAEYESRAPWLQMKYLNPWPSVFSCNDSNHYTTKPRQTLQFIKPNITQQSSQELQSALRGKLVRYFYSHFNKGILDRGSLISSLTSMSAAWERCTRVSAGTNRYDCTPSKVDLICQLYLMLLTQSWDRQVLLYSYQCLMFYLLLNVNHT